MPHDTATLTVADVAAHLQVGEKKVRAYIRKGDLKASNLGTTKRPRYAIRKAMLEAFLDDRAVMGIEEDAEVN